MRFILPVLFLLGCGALSAAPAQQVKTLQPFESAADLSGWQASGPTRLSRAHATQGKHSLRVLLEKAGSHIGSDRLAWNLQGYDKLKFDITNDGPPVIITLKVQDSKGASYQSWYYLVKTGYNRVEYIIDGMASALDIRRVRSVDLRIDAETPRPATFYIDNIRATRGEDNDSWLMPRTSLSHPIRVPGNLIDNPSFEWGFESWGSWGEWDGGVYTFGTGRGADAHSGAASAAIICQKEGRGGIYTEPIRVPAPGDYAVSLYIKGKDGARFRPDAPNAEVIGASERDAPGQWTRIAFKIKVSDASQPIRLYFYNVGRGILYVDDVSFLLPAGAASKPTLPSSGTGKPPGIEVEGDTLRVNGKPFFPIGMYDVADPQKQLQGTAFNLVTGGATSSSGTDYLDACAKAGVYTWINLTGLMRGHLPWKAPEVARRVKNHPAVLGWYLCDEPDHSAWNVPPPDLRLAKKLLMREDRGAHPAITLVMAWTPSNIYQYRDTCDILASDPYCVNGQRPYDLRYVSRTVDTMRRAVHDARPVWAVLQAGYDDTPEPTPEEEYAMTYLALTHGADGILWFALDYALQHPRLWQAIQDIAAELQALTPALTAKTVWIRQGAGHPSLHAILKETKDAYYLIAVNVPDRKAPQEDIQAVRLPLPLSRSGRADVLFENRSLPFRNGALTDAFRLYERHVYRIPKGG